MESLLDFMFGVYKGMDPWLVTLEMVAVFFGVLSVWLAKKENIWVFPMGLINTGIFVYILWIYGLLGDMLINGYFTLMNVYGWYVWYYRKGKEAARPIQRASDKERLYALGLFVGAIFFVIGVYLYFNKFNTWTAYVDTFTTALFFVAMWLMARKKWEHWHFWIVGNLITIPLYWYKGLTFTVFQYILFTIIAFQGYQSWKNNLSKTPQTL